MSRDEDDRIAAELAAQADARIAAEARMLTGLEVVQLRAAIAACARALAHINTKGLPFAHRRAVETARRDVTDATAIINRPSGTQPSGQATRVAAAG